MEHISTILRRLFWNLMNGEIGRQEYERQLKEIEDRQQKLQLGIGATTEVRKA